MLIPACLSKGSSTRSMEIEGLVRALREGDDAAKTAAAEALCRRTAMYSWYTKRVAEAGGIRPLVDLLSDGSAEGKQWAVRTLGDLAWGDDANWVLIAEAGGIPPLVELLRDGSAGAKFESARALSILASNNDANAVAIAVTVGLEALVQLARGGDVTVDNTWIVRNAGLPAKRKAALVVAALLRDCVPDEKRSQVRDLIRAVIGPCL